MPPFLPRKHLRSPSPEAGPSKRPAVGKSKPATPAARKPTLFDDLDAGTGKRRTVEDQKAILDKLVATDDEGSLSSLSSEDEFENVPGVQQKSINDGSGDEDDEIEFEDVETYTAPTQAGPAPSGDLELTLTRDTRISLTNPLGTKKGPTKIERQIRINTHQVHVQFLMFHNAIRNAWACDKELHGILLKHLSPGVEREIEKWRRRSGLSWNDQDGPEAQIKGKGKGKEVEKGKGKAKTPRGKEANPRSQRDWGQPAAMLEAGAVDISGGDPLFKLVEVLVAFWKQRFRITAPALRKLGYMPLQTLDEVTKSFEKVQHDPERYGEKIVGIEQFRVCASKMEGSRDVGAQLFTALLRAIGLDTRLVANLQPVGFGWGKYEEASEKNARQLKKPGKQRQKGDDSGHSDNSDASEEEQTEVKLTKPKTKAPARVKNTKKETPKTTRHSLRGDKGAPIDLSSSELSSLESDEESVVDVTPAKKSTKPSLPYDRDLVTPNYWSEVLSPVTNEYLPVDAIVLRLHATSQEQYERFLPPNKSERSRHITSYVVGHSSDGTAKDVTTRYLKWKKWPGRTKGYRLPPEKIPIHDRNGKIKHYEHKDWFKIVMSGYSRGSKNHPLTEVDHHEDATILQPAKPERRVVQEGKETIQYYKSSPEFVLERHLKREEALLPGAKHVKMFTTKKKGVEDSEERVFLRKDVVKCKSEETWHKEGRIPIIGVEPLKSVPYRAATINRKRQLKEQEQETGAKPLQGLYSLEQTEWIVSPPIENGHIPTNKYGNFDLFVDSMLPQGAVHLPFKGTVTICKRLGISFGEAVTDFEFGHGAAIPVVTGVVVAEEHEEAVMKEWRIYEDERQRKENEKRKRVAIGMWARMVRGLRLIKDFVAVHGEDGGHEVDEINPWTNRKTTAAEDKAIEKNRESMVHREEDLAGGFFPEGHHEEEVDQSSLRFFPGSQNPDESTGGGGFFVDEPEDPAELNSEAYATPHSLDSASRAPVQAEVQRDEKMDGRSDSDTPLPEVKKVGAKKRGRPVAGSSRKSNQLPTPSSATPILSRRPKIPGSSTSKPVKKQVSGANLSNEGESSSLSEPEGDGRSDDQEPPKKLAKRTPAKRATKPPIESASRAAPRKTPKRHAAKKSATALTSHYFEQEGDEDDEF